jgi:primosomal protein N' (replication factor Y)
MKCRLCGLPLVYHKNGRLSCHHCDVTEQVPDVCPKCGSRYIKYFGSGTEKLEQELREIMPRARVIRMDRDTTGTKFAHQEILNRFRRHEYDILLGTQMVAKGHDIPNVTSVGIISADSSLNMPDFRAAERCFMLITQTAGRAGRHGGRGQVIVQTYNPEHYAVTAGLKQDYEEFFRQELAMRKELFYPPYSRIVKLLFQDEDEEMAKGMGRRLVKTFEERFPGDRRQVIVGPSPAVIAKFRNIYRFVVLIKTADLPAVQEFLREQKLHLRTEVAIDIDPITML